MRVKDKKLMKLIQTYADACVNQQEQEKTFNELAAHINKLAYFELCCQRMADNFNAYVQIENGKYSVLMYKSEDESDSVNIDYCPWCGKKLN